MVRRSIHAWLAVAVLAALAAAGAPAGADPAGPSGRHLDRPRPGARAARLDPLGHDSDQGLPGAPGRPASPAGGIQASLDSERSELARIQAELRTARAHLAIVRAQLRQDMDALAQQLVANYESTQPDVVSVIFDAHGFSDLLDRVEGLRRIEERNVAAIRAVRGERRAVTRETGHLRNLAARQRRVTAATLVQHNEVARLKDAVLEYVLRFKRARAGKAETLASVRSRRR